MSKVEKIRIGLLVGGYSIPAIPTQSTENEGRVGRAGMPYPPTFVAFNPYNWLLHTLYYINLLHYNNRLLLSLHFPDDSNILPITKLYKLKIVQFKIAGVAENKSKFKTQNSKFALRNIVQAVKKCYKQKIDSGEFVRRIHSFSWRPQPYISSIQPPLQCKRGLFSMQY